MKKILVAIIILLLLAGAYLTGSLVARKSSTGAPVNAERKILHYVDPMNPSHTSDKPGLAPCGMKMEPVYADEAGGGPAGGPVLPGTVKLNFSKQQLVGIQMGTVEKKSVKHRLRLLGKVEPDATRTYQVTAPAEGWITKAMPITVGTPVRKDQTLAMLYSPTFISAGMAFRNALDYHDRMKTNGVERSLQRPGLAEFNVKQYADTLRSMGVSDRQINDMIDKRTFSEQIDVVSPSDGFMTLRNVSAGQRFEKGAELYRVVDLSRVWVIADVFNRDAPLVPPGVEAQISIPAQNLTIPAKLSEALPQFDNVTRTLKLRFEADNPQIALKLDMLVDVEFDVTLPETLVAPADAVLDSGMRKTVFVNRGNGYFEPRTVQTGWRVGEYVQVTHGLMAGEPIVVSGNFLLDSESRMKLAASGVHGAAQIDPVCGMGVDEVKARGANRVSQFNGKSYFFCNVSCKEEFDAGPAKFLDAKAETAQSTSPAAAVEIDPVCGMKVKTERAQAANRTVEHQGKIYYFCNDGCKEEFVAEPAKFLKEIAKQSGHDQSHH